MAKRYSREEALTYLEMHPDKFWSYVFDLCPQPIALVSVEGDFIRTNQALCKFLEYTDVELCDKTFSEITHPEDDGIDWANLKQIERGERDTYTMKKRYLTKSGDIVHLTLTVFPIRDPKNDNAVVHYVSHIVPYTPKHKLDMPQRNLHDSSDSFEMSNDTKLKVFNFVTDYWKEILISLAFVYGCWQAAENFIEEMRAGNRLAEQSIKWQEKNSQMLEELIKARLREEKEKQDRVVYPINELPLPPDEVP